VLLEKLGLRALREAVDDVALAVPLIIVMAGQRERPRQNRSTIV
jgi:hypothetical protein